MRADAIEDWLSGDYATGDWGGVRTQLEEAGITPEAAYTTDMMAVRNGNAGSGDGWDYAGRIDFGINFDFEKLAGIPGFSLYTSGAWSSGHNLSDRQVGNMFAVQQIYTGREVRLSEMYLQQQLLEDRLSFKVGRLTTENDFISSDIYTNYVNGGINGTPANIPGGNFGFTTAPFAQWGVVAAGEPVNGLRLAAGVYNANEHSVDDTRNGVDFDLDPGDGVLAIGEIGYSWNQPAEEEAAETTTAAAEAHQPTEYEPAEGDTRDSPRCRACLRSAGCMRAVIAKTSRMAATRTATLACIYHCSRWSMRNRTAKARVLPLDGRHLHAAAIDQRKSGLLRRRSRLQGFNSDA